MAIFAPKRWLNPFGKCQFFDFLNFWFLQLRKAFFVLQYHKRHFPDVYCRKKKVEKMAIFGPKPQVNPFGKMSILGLFEDLVFIAQKGVFSLQNIIKDIFLTYIAVKKKSQKQPFLDQNHGLTPLEKCQFFDFLKFLFLQLRKAFFRSRIS